MDGLAASTWDGHQEQSESLGISLNREDNIKYVLRSRYGCCPVDFRYGSGEFPATVARFRIMTPPAGIYINVKEHLPAPN